MSRIFESEINSSVESIGAQFRPQWSDADFWADTITGGGRSRQRLDEYFDLVTDAGDGYATDGSDTLIGVQSSNARLAGNFADLVTDGGDTFADQSGNTLLILE